jgi:hypothetical protein
MYTLSCRDVLLADYVPSEQLGVVVKSRYYHDFNTHPNPPFSKNTRSTKKKERVKEVCMTAFQDRLGSGGVRVYSDVMDRAAGLACFHIWSTSTPGVLDISTSSPFLDFLCLSFIRNLIQISLKSQNGRRQHSQNPRQRRELSHQDDE